MRHSPSQSSMRHPSHIQDRDIAILAYIARSRFASSQDIKRRFWPQCTARNHYRRLGYLVKVKLLTHLVGDAGARLGYRLTPEGRQLLTASGYEDGDEGASSKPFYKTAYLHDRHLIRLRDIFESLPIISDWVPEHILKKQAAQKVRDHYRNPVQIKVPDATFKLNLRSRVLAVALELELTVKAKARYTKMMIDTARMSGITTVFFVCGSDRILKVVRRHVEEAFATDYHLTYYRKSLARYFVTLDSLFSEGLDAKFVGMEKAFQLSALVPTPKPEAPST